MPIRIVAAVIARQSRCAAVGPLDSIKPRVIPNVATKTTAKASHRRVTRNAALGGVQSSVGAAGVAIDHSMPIAAADS